MYLRKLYELLGFFSMDGAEASGSDLHLKPKVLDLLNICLYIDLEG